MYYAFITFEFDVDSRSFLNDPPYKILILRIFFFVTKFTSQIYLVNYSRIYSRSLVARYILTLAIAIKNIKIYVQEVVYKEYL